MEGRIDWNDKAENIIGKINGLYPKPGAWFKFQNQRYKILKAKLSKKSGKIGEIIDKNLTICCGLNSIEIIEIQREGKKSQLIEDFLLGSKLKEGIILNNE